MTFGPGYGESSIVHVPPDVWLVVDSIAVAGTSTNPALEYLRRLGVASSHLVLTHPHQDHAAGFDRLLDAHDGLVGCVADWARSVDDPLRDPDVDRSLRNARAEHAVSAIKSRWESCPASHWELCMGGKVALGHGILDVLSPHPATLHKARNHGNVGPNKLSAAIAISWRKARVVLGADLPASEWSKVVRDAPALAPGDHDGLKIPHHASLASQHVSLSQPRGRHGRPWWTTPWNRGGKLPRFEGDQGVDVILQRNSQMFLTSLPMALSAAFPENVATRDQIEQAIRRSRFGASDIVLEYEGPAAEPEAAWVATSFAADGSTTVERGLGAWLLTA